MRELLVAAVLAAATLPALPASATEPVVAQDSFVTEPPNASNANCVATGVAPGHVVLAGWGTSAGRYAAVRCRLYQGGELVGEISRKLPGPVVAAVPGAFPVGSGPIHVQASVS